MPRKKTRRPEMTEAQISVWSAERAEAGKLGIAHTTPRLDLPGSIKIFTLAEMGSDHGI